MLCFDSTCMCPHTDRRLNNGDIDQASATGSARRNGWLRRHTGVSSTAVRPLLTPDLRPTSCTSFFTGPAVHVTSVLCSVCTSRVSAGVDWQVLGYSPQDLLLGLFPILSLQQLFVRVGQMKLCGAEHTNNADDLLKGCVSVGCVNRAFQLERLQQEM